MTRGGINCRVLDELTDGWFNAVFQVEMSDGRRAVVKIAPLPSTPVLRYELGVMGTEAMFYRRAAELDDVPIPELLQEGTDFLVVSAVNGSPWAEAASHLSAADRGTLLRELGQIAARLHALPCPDGRFGCPAPQAGLIAGDWRAAFTAMVEAILDDAARWDSPIGISPAEVRQMLADGSDALGEVRKASLIHFDLWPGNIFITGSRSTPGSRPRVTGIIDHERALWGDPAAELVSLEICGPAGPGSEFAAGYRDAGGRLDFTPAFRYRLALYRLYFGLILVTECGPRGYPPIGLHSAGPGSTAGCPRCVNSALSACPARSRRRHSRPNGARSPRRLDWGEDGQLSCWQVSTGVAWVLGQRVRPCPAGGEVLFDDWWDVAP